MLAGAAESLIPTWLTERHFHVDDLQPLKRSLLVDRCSTIYFYIIYYTLILTGIYRAPGFYLQSLEDSDSNPPSSSDSSTSDDSSDYNNEISLDGDKSDLKSSDDEDDNKSGDNNDNNDNNDNISLYENFEFNIPSSPATSPVAPSASRGGSAPASSARSNTPPAPNTQPSVFYEYHPWVTGKAFIELFYKLYADLAHSMRQGNLVMRAETPFQTALPLLHSLLPIDGSLTRTGCPSNLLSCCTRRNKCLEETSTHF